ncbi:MAG TPA: acyltransferase [Frateuria sp.]|uniref:acyltransferase family protein n=1 Tax=Frateuria sp. TaxID=2211372 RepID=UPI002D80F132|nr:acyltransferase [Frateuria sp.]HET6806270.1 acyltransferase [Frateuria sp.]
MAFLTYREAVGRIVRGDAQALTKQQISQTISFSRLVLIVGLVFLHYQQYPDVDASPFNGMGTGPHEIATFVNSFVLFFFFSVVPLLSMVSGWLFFSFDANTAGASLRQRIRRRFVSLYLPMVAWDVLYLAILIPLFLWKPQYPLFGDINIQFAHAGVWDYVNALFGITHHPVGFQFWFIRDLFTTVLVSPLLWWSLKRTPYLGMAFLGAAWLAHSSLVIFFRTDVVLFFYLGGFLRVYQVPLHVGRRTAWSLMALYVALIALRTAAPLLIDMSGSRPDLLNVATRATRVLGVVACWGVFQQLAQTRLGRVIAGYGGLAFFLHSAHFPLIAEVKVVLWRFLPAQTNGWLIAHYLASVTLTVAIGLTLGVVLARKLPKVFALMNGGRPGIGLQGQGALETVAGTPSSAAVAVPDTRRLRPLVGQNRQGWLRDALAVAAAPALLAILEVFHPHPDNLMALDVRTWLAVHYIQVPLFALSALAMVRLVRTRNDPAAWVCRVALFVFTMCFVVFDTAAGIVVGSLVQIAHASGTPEAWRMPIEAIWTHPILGGTDTPTLAVAGRLALAVGTIAAAVSLRRAGRPWAPVVLLALSGCVMEVFHSHSWPGGPVTFGGIALAALWLQWARPTPEATAPENIHPLRRVVPPDAAVQAATSVPPITAEGPSQAVSAPDRTYRRRHAG